LKLLCSKEFTVRGRWWLPGSANESIPGQLSFSNDAIRLELDGKFNVKELQSASAPFTCRFRTGLIAGETIDGDFCLLLNVFSLSVGWNACELAANRLLISDEPLDEVEPHLEGILVSLTYLEDWAHISLIDTSRGDPGNYKIVVPTDRRELLDLKGIVGFQSLKLWAGVTTQLKPGEAHCTTRCHFEAHFSPAITLSEALEFVGHLSNLLSLLVGDAVYARKVRPILKRQGTEPCVADFFAPSREAPTRVRRAPEMPIPLSQLTETERGIFVRWFGQAETLRPVYGLLLSSIQSHRQYPETVLLNLIQAIESLHRRIYGGHIASPSDYEQVRSALTNAIPPGTDPHLKEKLVGLLEFGNEPSLKSRLRELCSTLQPRTIEAVFGVSDLPRYLQLLADLRNYFTHYNDALKPRVKAIVENPIELYNLNQRVRAFATLLLLKHLGLEENKLSTGLTSHLGLAY
jgi:ApeA N-terminal domain 1